jgi:hypothetical protein
MNSRSRSLPGSDSILSALVILFGIFLILKVPLPVLAHTDGAMRLAAAPAGPFKLTVWTSPEPARTGEIHVAIAVTWAEDASPVLDANVEVQLISLSGDQSFTETATTENSVNKFLYEAVFDIQRSGAYEVSITVAGGGGETGQAHFPLDIMSNAPINWMVLVGAGAIILALVAVLIQRRQKQARLSQDEE